MMFLKYFRFRYGVVSDKVNALIVFVLLTFALPAHTKAAEAVRILALGDSLSAGYGLMQADAFPNQLQRALNNDGIDAVVINAGVSGDTSAGGLSRLAWALSAGVDAVIIELGANDGLRGFDPGETFKNLDAILDTLKRRELAILLTGMRAPPNLGEDYGREFASIYPRLANKHGVPFYPFFLEGVATIAELNQDDTIHPNARGVKVVAKGILPYVKEMLQGIKK
jgi:acyl-CoA thioesterase I